MISISSCRHASRSGLGSSGAGGRQCRRTVKGTSSLPRFCTTNQVMAEACSRDPGSNK